MSVWPVMKAPALPASRTARPAMSSGSPMRRSGAVAQALFEILGVVPQRLGEVGLHQAGRDGVHADVVGPVLEREVARELHVGRLGDAVGADHRRAAHAADRRHDDDRAVLLGPHVGQAEIDHPHVGENVVVHHLHEDVVGQLLVRPVVGIGRGVADQHVDRPELLLRLGEQPLDLRLVGDVAGDDRGMAAGLAGSRPPPPRRPAPCATTPRPWRPRARDASRSTCRCPCSSR